MNRSLYLLCLGSIEKPNPTVVAIFHLSIHIQGFVEGDRNNGISGRQYKFTSIFLDFSMSLEGVLFFVTYATIFFLRTRLIVGKYKRPKKYDQFWYIKEIDLAYLKKNVRKQHANFVCIIVFYSGRQ